MDIIPSKKLITMEVRRYCTFANVEAAVAELKRSGHLELHHNGSSLNIRLLNGWVTQVSRLAGDWVSLDMNVSIYKIIGDELQFWDSKGE